MFNLRYVASVFLGSLALEAVVQLACWLLDGKRRTGDKKAIAEEEPNQKEGDVTYETLFFPESSTPCRYHYQNQNCHRHDCPYTHEAALLGRLLAIVDSSQETLNVCVYIITCGELRNAILKVHRRGVRVRIVTDGNAPDDAAVRVAKFREAGVGLRTSPPGFLMHHKFILVDDKQLVNGSFNWTWGAITGNSENLFITSNRALVRAYSDEFTKLWNAYDPKVLREAAAANAKKGTAAAKSPLNGIPVRQIAASASDRSRDQSPLS